MSRNSSSSRRSCSGYVDADIPSSSYIVSLEKMGHPDYVLPTRSPARPPANHVDSPSRHVDPHKSHFSKGGLHIGLPRVKVRFCSFLFLVAKMKRSCGRAVMLAASPPAANPKCQRGSSSSNSKLARGISGGYTCGGSYPDAVVDCIDYIKKSATIEPGPTKC